MSTTYAQIFRNSVFRLFWIGFTFSSIGDVMSRVALTWFVYKLTNSSEALGLLSLTYTGPVILGGLVAGMLLDRFDRRQLMIADNLIRGCVMTTIPLLYMLNLLELWHIYLASAVYGLLMMISLAGSPSLVPSLVEKQHLVTANALETLSYTLSGVVGPFIAGWLIPLIGAPNVVLIDALSYLGFAVVLLRIRPVEQPRTPTTSHPNHNHHFKEALGLLFNNRVLLSTTLMFMAFNLGAGILFVWLPILADRLLGGNADLYGLLLGAMALGEVVASTLSGALRFPFKLGVLICSAQLFAGLSLSFLLVGLSIPTALISLFLLGGFSAPLTIWAQTLRMQIIPDGLRGRTFALLRTMMQATGPAGGALGGVLVSLLSAPVLVTLCSLIIGIPAALGYSVSELRTADASDS